VLKGYKPTEDGWSTQFRPRKVVAARHRFEQMVEERVDDPGERKQFHELLQTSEAPDDVVADMEAYLDAVLGNL